ncbi:hypothetical protein [Maritimibacter sp. DP1N21-5]|uniref:hypothetical protein n=1 Tax=Maritimibacter sp. DP1N21-5 TaxID=2836867 RepID=UPI001C49676E|nr:hypothetical protein [Maritimibacter sp. DP1N21-5]MBV7408453.1 hypothetical protein [Maritimibacter sp. DP1N21-5]
MIRLAAALALLTAPALAQTVTDCAQEVDLRLIAEPWDSATRAFPEGDIRVVLLDTRDPAPVPFRLLILSPPYNDDGTRQCKVISGAEDWGYANMDLAAHDAAFDPDTGLLFSLPVTIWRAADETTGPATLSFSLNAGSGEIATNLDLPGE